MFASVCFAEDLSEDKALVQQYAKENKKIAASQPTKQEVKKTEKKIDEPNNHIDRPKDYGYKPNSEINIELDYKKNDYDIALEKAKLKSNQEVLVNAQAATVVPKNIETKNVVYPADWPQKVEKRKKYKDGVVAKNKKTTIYEISDITYKAPNFSHEDNLYQNDWYARNYAEPEDRNPFNEPVRTKPEASGPTFGNEEADAIAQMVLAMNPDAKISYVCTKLGAYLIVTEEIPSKDKNEQR